MLFLIHRFLCLHESAVLIFTKCRQKIKVSIFLCSLSSSLQGLSGEINEFRGPERSSKPLERDISEGIFPNLSLCHPLENVSVQSQRWILCFDQML